MLILVRQILNRWVIEQQLRHEAPPHSVYLPSNVLAQISHLITKHFKNFQVRKKPFKW